MYEKEWTNETVIRLMQEYSRRPGLWDVKHSMYRIHPAKYEAWSELAQIFNCDIADLRKKLNSLFASHRREKAKIRSGGRSTWFLYPYMAFLPTHLENNTEDISMNIKDDEYQPECRDTEHTSSDDERLEEETLIIKQEPVEMRPKKRFVPINVKSRPIKRRFIKERSTSTTRQLDSKLVETLKLLKRSDLSKKKDECDTFGEYIATSLRKHDDRTQSMIKQAINNILFEQEMKKYSGGQYTVVLTGIEENPLILGDQESDNKFSN